MLYYIPSFESCCVSLLLVHRTLYLRRCGCGIVRKDNINCFGRILSPVFVGVYIDNGARVMVNQNDHIENTCGRICSNTLFALAPINLLIFCLQCVVVWLALVSIDPTQSLPNVSLTRYVRNNSKVSFFQTSYTPIASSPIQRPQ